MGPTGRRRGRGARERLLKAAHELFRDQGVNRTGMDQLCQVAQVSKRTAYQHFGSKDELIAEHLRQHDAAAAYEVLDRDDLAPRERLLAVFAPTQASPDGPTPLCPFIRAAVEIADVHHPARVLGREYKTAIAARLSSTARQAGATDPDLLGEQLALLLDGASARARTLGVDTTGTAARIAATLVQHALPDTAPDDADPPSDR